MANKICALLIAGFTCLSVSAETIDLKSKVDSYTDELLELYTDLHLHPELSFFEERTSAKLAAMLVELGYDVQTDLADTYAIAGILRNGDGPTVLIRTDMDGLPILEDTGLPYASKATNVDESGQTLPTMHGCGHDIHMTSWMGTAKFLSEHKELWKGTVIMLGQPAEERGGARFLFRKNLFGGIIPVPDYCIALHASANLPAGTVGHTAGPSLASTDMIDITVFGKGGHGAYPHMTTDPIVLAARMILDFQTIVSREIAPIEPAVVTVGSIHGGSKHNIIPSEVKLELTVRAYSDQVRQHILSAIQRIANGVAMSAGLDPEKYPKIYVREEGVPATFNHPELTQQLFLAHQRLLGKDKVTMVEPVMAGEDFAYYGRTKEQIPICIYWLGTVAQESFDASERGEKVLPSLHSPFFAPDPIPSLQAGVLTMTGAALELLGKP
jgi:amidohydrolase